MRAPPQPGRAVLGNVTAGRGGALAGLDAPGLPAAALQEAEVLIIAHFIELLVTLIGEDLALGLVGNVWREAAASQSLPGNSPSCPAIRHD